MTIELCSFILSSTIFTFLGDTIFIFFTYISIIGITILIDKKNFTVGILLLAPNHLNYRQINFVFSIALLQIIVVCLVYFDVSKFSIFIFLTIILMIFIIFFTFNLIRSQEDEIMKNSENIYLKSLEQLTHSISSQRHDYMNHLHVISNLVFTESYEEAKYYLKDLNTNVNIDHSLLKLNHPSLVALLQAKREYASINKIEMDINIKSNILNLPLKSYELIQIVGNIIDNAFDEELASTEFNKKVAFTMDNLYSSILVISIRNRNSLMNPEEIEKSCLEGYSKKENHKGIGLFTVRNLLNKYKGYYEVESNKETGTTFFIFIPYTKR
ncbi:sensor histidine kinase [Lysinibacillus sp. NPDC094403]|uniref:sensor histidine kinase n=1 Tax=Lysinibacillus sp. NPDC094403 TaxID=3390581 RepID=UPI003CFF975B